MFSGKTALSPSHRFLPAKQYDRLQLMWLMQMTCKAIEVMLGLKEDTQYTEKPLTDEEIRDCWELINGTETYLREDMIISKIIIEEAESYFSGEKSAEEAAKIIQSKVSLYLQEQFQ